MQARLSNPTPRLPRHRRRSALWTSTVLLLMGLFTVAGCSGTRGLTPDVETPALFPNHSVGQIQRAIAAATDTLSAFQSRARVKIHAPEMKRTLTVRLWQRAGDSLYATIHANLGIEAARTLVTPDSFFVYDRFNRRLLYGPLAYAGTYLPTPASTDELFANLTGILAPPADIAWRVEADSALYTLHDPAGLLTYTIDPALWRVTRFEARAPSGALLDEREFYEFEEVDGVIVPRRIRFYRPQDDSEVLLHHQKLTLNPDVLSFAFKTGRINERVLLGGAP